MARFNTHNHGLVNQPTLEELAAEYVTTFNRICETQQKGRISSFEETFHIREEMHRRFGEERTNAGIKQMFELDRLMRG